MGRKEREGGRKDRRREVVRKKENKERKVGR